MGFGFFNTTRLPPGVTDVYLDVSERRPRHSQKGTTSGFEGSRVERCDNRLDR